MLPERLTRGLPSRGPLLTEDVWDLRCVLPRTWRTWRLDFTQISDPTTRRTAKEYVASRLHRGSLGLGPMKATAAATELRVFIAVMKDLREVGAPRLSAVGRTHLDAVLTRWKPSPDNAVRNVTLLKHLAAQGPFLSQDRLNVLPWNGRSAYAVAGVRRIKGENTTPRIPEEVLAPLLRAAVFYVEKASGDILTAQREIAALEAARKGQNLGHGQARERVLAFIAQRRAAGRGIPALPRETAHTVPGVATVDDVPQSPNHSLVSLLTGCGNAAHLRPLMAQAGEDIGYEEGGLDTPMSEWAATGSPWRPRLSPLTLANELSFLRTACWIVIAYLSGMRDVEVRELARDCATTETGADGRPRYKLRGRVYKGKDRKLSGDEAEWVVLDVVHRAVAVLKEINDDPGHLFGYDGGGRNGYVLLTNVPRRIRAFRDHLNTLFSTAGELYIPLTTTSPNGHSPDEETEAEIEASASTALPWAFDTRQFRRTLAWHIAHQPFGVVAGARQYKHAAIIMFEGYAGTSASGFADEVAAEEAVAKLDYVEDLYHDWNEGGRSAGGAAQRIAAEFDRIRSELGDLPGAVASPSRLRTLLHHLTKTLHPGVLNDCFYQAETAVCRKRAKPLGRPVPMLDMCMRCPNSRRSAIHVPRLERAHDMAESELGEATGLPRLQQLAITEHLATLTRLIAEIDHEDTRR
ncbi:integrase [Streptomyces atrovirens]